MPYVKKTKYMTPDMELRALIASTGIKVSKIAEHAGVSAAAVSLWSAGKHKIPPLVIEWLRDVDAVVNRKGGGK